jgi:hypothetical protein
MILSQWLSILPATVVSNENPDGSNWYCSKQLMRLQRFISWLYMRLVLLTAFQLDDKLSELIRLAIVGVKFSMKLTQMGP